MKKYAIWNKTDPIVTPAGKVFTAEQWKELYPVAALDNITVLCSVGEINGGYFGTLGQMVAMYEAEGYDFSGCKTDEEKLAAIEAYDDAKAVAEAEAIEEAKIKEETQIASLASIAASMQYQNMLTLEDVEE